MKLRAFVIIGGLLLAGSLTAQTLTDVINEFNTGVEKLNNQEYDVAINHFNQVLSMAETVGDEANDMKEKAQQQIPSTHYRQATLFMKRKRYDNAIPYLEKTVEYATLYGNNEEMSKKAIGYLPQLYVREGNREWKNDNFEQAIAYFDKALAVNENIYQAHQGKGMVYLEQDEADLMVESFNKAKEGAMAKNDTKTIGRVNAAIDSYYNKYILEEMALVDPEDNDYTYVVEACENALAANPDNPRALYHLAIVSNKSVEYDKAIEYAEKALANETEPVWISAIQFELGSAFQNTADYTKACEALKKVTEEPFLTQAEKKMGTICN
jgi:tetratricopeptide (TPR) repeat protein